MKRMIQTISQNIIVIGMLADGIELVISPVQERVKGSPGKRGVTLTPQTSGDVGLRREPAHIPNISKHISSKTTDKSPVCMTV